MQPCLPWDKAEKNPNLLHSSEHWSASQSAQSALKCSANISGLQHLSNFIINDGLDVSHTTSWPTWQHHDNGSSHSVCEKKKAKKMQWKKSFSSTLKPKGYAWDWRQGNRNGPAYALDEFSLCHTGSSLRCMASKESLPILERLGDEKRGCNHFTHSRSSEIHQQGTLSLKNSCGTIKVLRRVCFFHMLKSSYRWKKSETGKWLCVNTS